MFLVQNSEAVTVPAVNGALVATKTVAHQVFLLLNASAERLSIWQKLGDHWLQHRSGDLRAAAAAVNRLTRTTNPTDILQAYSELSADGLRRFAEEATAYPDYIASLNTINQRAWQEFGGELAPAAEAITRNAPAEVAKEALRRGAE